MDLLNELKRQLDALKLDVAPNVREQLIGLQQELLRWNKTYNLTAINNPLEVIEKHLVDSLTLLPYIKSGDRLLDIGSGAGFPALPLKFARADLEVVSVDAVAKKIRFQKHIVRKFGLQGFTAWHGRAEALPDNQIAAAGFDLIVARAFSSLSQLLELAGPCLKPQGQVVALKGPEGEVELAQAEGWLKKNSFQCTDVVHLRLPTSQSVRQLLFFGR